MRKTVMFLATAASLAAATVAAPSTAEARHGFGPGLAGGLIASAVIGGLASSALAYGPGYGYAPAYYGGYAPAYYDGYAPVYYGPRYRRVVRPAFAYYGGPRYVVVRHHRWHRPYWW
jgi:hypothetical protein